LAQTTSITLQVWSRLVTACAFSCSVLVGWPKQVATTRVGRYGSGFIAPPGEHDIAEHQRIGAQCAENCAGVSGGDISNASTCGLGLNVEVWLTRIARVSYFGDLLA